MNSILSAYVKKAADLKIQTEMDVRVAEGLKIRDVDWVAILANVFEKAIHGCASSECPRQEIIIYIAQKGRKIIIECRNTSTDNITFQKGIPKSQTGGGTGVLSIIKAASRYDGETDFTVENGMFITRILLNLPVSGSI